MNKGGYVALPGPNAFSEWFDTDGVLLSIGGVGITVCVWDQDNHGKVFLYQSSRVVKP